MHSQKYLASIALVIPIVHFFPLVWLFEEQRKRSTMNVEQLASKIFISLIFM